MYRPGTQLIITELWAAAAAHKLGFVVHSNPNNNEYVIQNDIGWVHMFLPDVRVWRITVTESGPNAAKKFLPQKGDLAFCVETSSPLEIPEEPGIFRALAKMTGLIPVLYRNGIPFPQFSEVIEP